MSSPQEIEAAAQALLDACLLAGRHYTKMYGLPIDKLGVTHHPNAKNMFAVLTTAIKKAEAAGIQPATLSMTE